MATLAPVAVLELLARAAVARVVAPDPFALVADDRRHRRHLGSHRLGCGALAALERGLRGGSLQEAGLTLRGIVCGAELDVLDAGRLRSLRRLLLLRPARA